MRCFLIATCLVFAASVVTAAEEGFTPLFDGKTFDGWEGNLPSFRIDPLAGARSFRATPLAQLSHFVRYSL